MELVIQESGGERSGHRKVERSRQEFFEDQSRQRDWSLASRGWGGRWYERRSKDQQGPSHEEALKAAVEFALPFKCENKVKKKINCIF